MGIKALYFAALFIFLLSVIGCSLGNRQGDQKHLSENEAAPSEVRTSDTGYFLFPKGGERLIKGRTYTLKWKGNTDSTVTLFLIDSSLESEGVSVSIADRIYGIPNKGTYRYRFPERIKAGTYKFQVGKAESGYFQVVDEKK